MSKTVTYIKTSSINRKLAQIASAIVLLVITLNIWVTIKYEGESLLDENALVLADNILLQTSHSAGAYIANDDLLALEQLTDSALKSEYIHEMIIYDDRGVELSKSENAVSTRQRFLEEKNEELESQAPVPFVKEIRAENNELLGFVRITVLRAQLQKKGLGYIHTITKQSILLALLAGLIGYLLTVGLRPFSANSFVFKK